MFQADSLTARERQALSMILQGCSDDEISKRMGVSIRTAEAHIAAVLRAFKVNSKLGVAAAVLKDISERTGVPLPSDRNLGKGKKRILEN